MKNIVSLVLMTAMLLVTFQAVALSEGQGKNLVPYIEHIQALLGQSILLIRPGANRSQDWEYVSGTGGANTYRWYIAERGDVYRHVVVFPEDSKTVLVGSEIGEDLWNNSLYFDEIIDIVFLMSAMANPKSSAKDIELFAEGFYDRLNDYKYKDSYEHWVELGDEAILVLNFDTNETTEENDDLVTLFLTFI